MKYALSFLLMMVFGCGSLPEAPQVDLTTESVEVKSTSRSSEFNSQSSSRKQVTLEVVRKNSVLYDVGELTQNEIESARIALNLYRKTNSETDVFAIDFESRGGQGFFEYYAIELMKLDTLERRISDLLVGASEGKLSIADYCHQDYIPSNDAERLQTILVAEGLTQDNLVFHGFSKGVDENKQRVNYYFYSLRGGQDHIYQINCGEEEQDIQGLAMYGF